MKLKTTNKRVLTSPLLTSLVLIEGEQFEDGKFRIVAPEGTPPEVIAALDDVAREVDGLFGRREWLSDVLAFDEIGRQS